MDAPLLTPINGTANLRLTGCRLASCSLVEAQKGGRADRQWQAATHAGEALYASLLPSRSQTQSRNVLEKLGKIFRRIVTPCQVKRFEAAWNDDDQAGSVKLRTDPRKKRK